MLSALLLIHVYVLVDVLDFVIVDVLDFVIVLFRSGVFEYILFCNRAVFATHVHFG